MAEAGRDLRGDGTERFRIGFLVARDGEAAAAAWVRRTLAIYRRAVLDPGHFASTPDYRRQFLASCADFRRWLAKRAQADGRAGDAGTPAPAAASNDTSRKE